MKDITNVRLLYFKGFLLMFGGLLAAVGVLLEHPTMRMAILLALAIWCFCRAYYFAFYVIEHYIDGEYRFAGLGSFVLYLFRR